MVRYIARRILLLVPIFLGISVLTFVLIDLAPGDPALAIAGPHATPDVLEHYRVVLGLDRPMPIRYLEWLVGALRGDLGFSMVAPVPVTEMLGRNLNPTLYLTAFAGLIAMPAGLLTGVTAAVKRGKLYDISTRLGWLVGLSMPSFWLGLLLILIFGVQLQVLPVGGYVSPISEPVEGLRRLLLPALTLALPMGAVLSRIIRATVLEFLEKDFVRTARAMGVSERWTLYRHVVPNAAAPTLTTLGTQIATLLGGVVLVEQIFNIPGLGKLLIFGVENQDFGVVQGVVLFGAFAVVVIQLLVDIVIARIDTRIVL